MTMPLPVWINLHQAILRNTSNMPCDISDEEVLIIVLLVFFNYLSYYRYICQ